MVDRRREESRTLSRLHADLTTKQLSLDVWRLRHNLTSYDATYVALAAALDCPLLTADGGMAQAPNIGVAVVGV